MKIPVFNTKTKEEIPVKSGVFDVEFSEKLFAQAISVYLGNQRTAKAKTKTRSEVTGSGFKIWKQKGTGRARHGNRKAPIFVGGGVSFGPTGKENYKGTLTKKMTRKAILSVLSEKLREKKLFILQNLNLKKTKEAAVLINEIKENFKIKKGIGILLSRDENLKRYFDNLNEVTLLFTQSLSPYTISRINYLFITKKALEDLEGLVGKKEKNVH